MKLYTCWQRGTSLIEALIVIAIVAILFASAGSGCSCGLTKGEGYRIGRIQKVVDKGIIWKTNEVEIATKGHRSSGYGMTNVWEASVWSDAIFVMIQALPDGVDYKFHYRQHRIVMPWTGATVYEIYKVESFDAEGNSHPFG